MSLTDLLKLVRGKSGLSVKEMHKFLGVAFSTYKSYEKGRNKPRPHFYRLYNERTGVDLKISADADKICYTDSGKKMKAIQKVHALRWKIPVYFNHSIQDIVYTATPPPPAFEIIYPGTKRGSFCIRTSIGFVICRNISKSRINRRNLSLVVMKENGLEETGHFHRDGPFVVIEERKIAIARIYRVFEISHILPEDELTNRII